MSVAKWKYIAKEKVPASSWHHTSAYYNQTHHYDLHTIAEEIIRVKDTLDEDYKAYKKEQNQPVSDIEFAVMKVQVWGGQGNDRNLKVTKRLPASLPYVFSTLLNVYKKQVEK